MEPRQELSDELRKARGWILGVGIMMFVVDQFMLRVLQGDKIPASWQTNFLILDICVLAYFVGLYIFAKQQPKAACVLALIGFWGLHIGVAIYFNAFETVLTQGILIKVLFTVALVRGLKSASRAEYLRKDLEKVFG